MKTLLFTLAFLGLSVIASAQTKPVNPRIVEFNPAMADYDATTRFEIAYFAPGATQPVQGPVDLGKPLVTAVGCQAPAVDPCARVDINTQPTPFGLDYIARVRAVAVVASVDIPGEWSDPSNFFDRKPGKPGGTVVK